MTARFLLQGSSVAKRMAAIEDTKDNDMQQTKTNEKLKSKPERTDGRTLIRFCAECVVNQENRHSVISPD